MILIYRERAKKVVQQVKAENGTKKACDAIEQMLLPGRSEHKEGSLSCAKHSR